MKTTINNVTIEITKEVRDQMEQAVKDFDGGEEIQKEEEYFCRDYPSNTRYCRFLNDSTDIHRKEQDNLCPVKYYTEEQADEYFNKRDARRAAETKLRKAIADVNKKYGWVCDVNNITQTKAIIVYSILQKGFDLSLHKESIRQPIWMQICPEGVQEILDNHVDLYKTLWEIE